MATMGRPRKNNALPTPVVMPDGEEWYKITAHVYFPGEAILDYTVEEDEQGKFGVVYDTETAMELCRTRYYTTEQAAEACALRMMDVLRDGYGFEKDISPDELAPVALL